MSCLQWQWLEYSAVNTIFILQVFKLNKLLINESEATIETGLEEESDKIEKISLIYTFWKSVSWSFFQQRKRPGLIKLLPSTGAVWCHFNFFQKRKRLDVFWLFPATESVSWIMTKSNNERSRLKYPKRLVVVF